MRLEVAEFEYLLFVQKHPLTRCHGVYGVYEIMIHDSLSLFGFTIVLCLSISRTSVNIRRVIIPLCNTTLYHFSSCFVIALKLRTKVLLVYAILRTRISHLVQNYPSLLVQNYPSLMRTNHLEPRGHLLTLTPPVTLSIRLP